MIRLGLISILFVWLAVSVLVAQNTAIPTVDPNARVLNKVELYNQHGYLMEYETFQYSEIANDYRMVRAETKSLLHGRFVISEYSEYCYNNEGDKFRENRYVPGQSEPIAIKNYTYQDFESRNLETNRRMLHSGNFHNTQTDGTNYFKYYYNSYFELIEKSRFNELGSTIVSERFYYYPPHRINQTQVFEQDENHVLQRTLTRRYDYDEYNRLQFIVTYNIQEVPIKIVEFQYNSFNELVAEISYTPMGRMDDFHGDFRERAFKDSERRYYYGPPQLIVPPCTDQPPQGTELSIPSIESITPPATTTTTTTRPQPTTTTRPPQPTTTTPAPQPTTTTRPPQPTTTTPAPQPTTTTRPPQPTTTTPPPQPTTTTPPPQPTTTTPPPQPTTTTPPPQPTTTTPPPQPTTPSPSPAGGPPLEETGVQLDNVITPTSNMFYHDDVIYYAGNDRTIHGYKADLSEEDWAFNANLPIISLPVVDDENVYYSTITGSFIAIKKSNQSQVWSASIRGTVNKDVVPYMDDQGIYFGTSNGLFYAIKKGDGSNIWDPKDVGSGIFNSPTYDPDTNLLIFGCDNGKLIALDKGNGNKAWEVQQDNAIRRTKAILHNGRVGSIDEEGGVMICNASDGSSQQTLTLEAPFGTAVGYQQFMLYPTSSGKVMCINLTNNSKAWEHQIGSGQGSTYNLAIVNNFVLASDGTVKFEAINVNDNSEVYEYTAVDRINNPMVASDDALFLLLDGQHLLRHDLR